MSGFSLLAPLGLIALLGIPLVVLYHMRHTTPDIREVPTLRFWRVAMREETHHERFKRPPVSLLLILHLLLVGLIAFALARPAASRALGGFGARLEPRHVILLLDGSTSMSAVDTATRRTKYEIGREIARARLGELRDGDVATVILMGTHSTTLEATDSAGMKAIRERLDRLTIPGGRADLNAALNLTADLMLPTMDDEVVLITDGALAADPSVVAKIDASIELVTVGGAEHENVAITDIATKGSTTASGEQQLYARIVNFGARAVTAPVAVIADGIELSRGEITVAPNGGAEEIVQDLPAGAGSVEIRIEVVDALPADNTASSVLIQGQEFGLRVLLVSEVPTELQRALAVLPGARVTMMSPVEASAARIDGAFDLVVYEHTAPPDQMPNVPVLLVYPEPDGRFPTNGVMAAPVAERVRAQDPLMRGVELAGVTFGQTPIYTLDATATEVVGGGDGPLIVRGTTETGEPYVMLAFDIAQSNLARRVAFPILIANIASELAPSPLPSAAALGDPLSYRPHSGAATVRFIPPTGEQVDLDVVARTDNAGVGESFDIVTFAHTGQPGRYAVTELDANGNTIGSGAFVVNAGHTRESDLTPNAALPETLATAGAGAAAGSRAALSDFWPAIVAAAFIVLLLEWLVTLLPRRRSRRQPLSTSPAG
ncbi:MAG: BatA domain-containing protein [Thermomicrobiales bacterium]|nr:BatA domain-containing protein [Thermomicrobiales bacterium]